MRGSAKEFQNRALKVTSATPHCRRYCFCLTAAEASAGLKAEGTIQILPVIKDLHCAVRVVLHHAIPRFPLSYQNARQLRVPSATKVIAGIGTYPCCGNRMRACPLLALRSILCVAAIGLSDGAATVIFVVQKVAAILWQAVKFAARHRRFDGSFIVATYSSLVRHHHAGCSGETLLGIGQY